MAREDRPSKKFRGSDRLPGGLETIRNVFQKLHAQTMAARRERFGCERLRKDSDSHQPRRSLPRRKISGPAERWLHGHVCENAWASKDRIATQHRLSRRARASAVRPF